MILGSKQYEKAKLGVQRIKVEVKKQASRLF